MAKIIYNGKTTEVGLGKTATLVCGGLNMKSDVVVEIDANSEEKYNGTYNVIPKTVAQSLHTKNKVLEQDIVINSIPYAEVSNVSGGKTATIA